MLQAARKEHPASNSLFSADDATRVRRAPRHQKPALWKSHHAVQAVALRAPPLRHHSTLAILHLPKRLPQATGPPDSLRLWRRGAAQQDDALSRQRPGENYNARDAVPKEPCIDPGIPGKTCHAASIKKPRSRFARKTNGVAAHEPGCSTAHCDAVMNLTLSPASFRTKTLKLTHPSTASCTCS